MIVPWVLLVPLLGTELAGLHAQSALPGPVAPVTQPSPPAQPSTANRARTRWTFQAQSPVSVDSSIVYLRDVVRPRDPDLAAWGRLSRSPIGLVPANGTPMIIRRERLAEAIRAAEATAVLIEIQGPKSIEVAYVPDTARVAAAKPQTNAAPATAAVPIAGGDRVTQAAAHGPSKQGPSKHEHDLDSVTQKRLVYWIETAIAKGDHGVADRYEFTVPPHQPELAELADARRLRDVRFVDSVSEGLCRVMVTGKTADGSVDSEIQIRLDALPQAVTSRSSLRRGHRITDDDLTTIPVPTGQWRDAFATDPEALVGQEVYSPLRAGQPIRRGDVRRPVLIKRGDLVEVRVIGGAITVTANAKSLGEGGAMDLVQVETLDPKRKVVARVVEPGLVEVISRAPGASQ